LANLFDPKAEPTRRAAWALMIQAHTWNALAYSAAEIPPAVTLAAAEAGATRAEAERPANLALLFWAVEPNNLLGENGMPELLLPPPEVWGREVKWAALFNPDGASPVTGAIQAQSRAELQAEEAGTAEIETAGSA
jgi:hypothetical protein